MTLIRFNESFSFHKENFDGGKKRLEVSGIAINATKTRNGVRYLSEELAKSASTLRDKPILKDHEAKIDNVVGRTTGAAFTGDSVSYTGYITDEKVIEAITDGRITNVSIGAMVANLDEDKVNNEIVARGITFLEISIVAIPGDENATIHHGFAAAVHEAFNISKSNSTKAEENNMEDFKSIKVVQESDGSYSLMRDNQVVAKNVSSNTPATPKGKVSSGKDFDGCTLERYEDGSCGFFRT